MIYLCSMTGVRNQYQHNLAVVLSVVSDLLYCDLQRATDIVFMSNSYFSRFISS